MEVDRQYVDSHGQSAVAFAFCHLLGFQLLPRLKAIHKQRLYRPEAGRPEAYPNLEPVLRRPINWNLIAPEYDNMIKYRTALRLGTAETDAILRRFTRPNVQHPTYTALGTGQSAPDHLSAAISGSANSAARFTKASMSWSIGTAPMISSSLAKAGISPRIGGKTKNWRSSPCISSKTRWSTLIP
jgi:hypothetical protein